MSLTKTGSPQSMHLAAWTMRFHRIVAFGVDLLPVRDALHGRAVGLGVPLIIHKAPDVAR